MNVKVLAIILAVGTAMALPAGAQARSDSDIFCASIALSPENQAACMKQLASANSNYSRKSMLPPWVARGEIMENPSRFSAPPQASRTLLPRSTTHFRAKVNYVPNRVAAEINRAVKAVRTDPAFTGRVAD